MHVHTSGCLFLANLGCPNRPLTFKADSLTWDAALADVGRVLIRLPTSFNPFSSKYVRNTLSSQLASNFFSPSTELGLEGHSGQGLP
ncbi:unnamed protein product [Schistocephalus solidus]|uniref:Uncharacterized protein n=1 Tax=Schistocephalus solidus TaxID=70667 RepID=A0A183S8J7_SCHSO|nr:unnamed protein product [Schistocephalus solidus]